MYVMYEFVHVDTVLIEIYAAKEVFGKWRRSRR